MMSNTFKVLGDLEGENEKAPLERYVYSPV